MKGIVVYYSGTGNTMKIAKAIHRGMKQVIEADVALDRDVDPKDMGEYDLFGIGSPIWFFRETANVRQFVSYLPDMSGKLGFAYAVHGAAPSGIFHSMIPPMNRKGLTIIGWNDWFGSDYQVVHAPKPYPSDGHPDAIDLEEAEAWGKELAERAQRIYAGEKDLIPEIPHGPDADPLFHPHGKMTFFPGADIPHRTINQEKCLYPECTLCIDNCETNSLDFSVDPPTYNAKTCINCALCDRMCPVGAIEIPADELYRMRTAKSIDMEKCKYPECTICVDHCMMNAIDFSVTPPAFTYRCEGDDLCWTICPEGAIEIVNLDITHGKMVWDRRIQRETGRAVEDHGFMRNVNNREAQGRFRRLVPKEQIGMDGSVLDIQRYPRFDINELMVDTPLSPYHGMPDHSDEA